MDQTEPTQENTSPQTPLAAPAETKSTSTGGFSVIGKSSRQIFGTSIVANLIGTALSSTLPIVQKILAVVAIITAMLGVVRFMAERKEGSATTMTYIMLVLGLFLGLIAGIGFLFAASS